MQMDRNLQTVGKSGESIEINENTERDLWGRKSWRYSSQCQTSKQTLKTIECKKSHLFSCHSTWMIDNVYPTNPRTLLMWSYLLKLRYEFFSLKLTTMTVLHRFIIAVICLLSRIKLYCIHCWPLIRTQKCVQITKLGDNRYSHANFKDNNMYKSNINSTKSILRNDIGKNKNHIFMIGRPTLTIQPYWNL